jgi:hypothetical protein
MLKALILICAVAVLVFAPMPIFGVDIANGFVSFDELAERRRHFISGAIVIIGIIVLAIYHIGREA